MTSPAPGRLAVVSDIHGNRNALEAVLADITEKGITDVVNLGDNVYGPLDPAGTAELLIELGWPTVRGNEDRIIVSAGADSPTVQYVRQSLNRAQMEWLEGLPSSPAFALAGLVTHASDVYSKENCEKGLESLAAITEGKRIRYLGCFDCQGRLAPPIQPMVQKSQGLSDEEWAERMAKTDQHPDAEDEKKAREFARAVTAEV